jgi:small subunit ribosomal protein S8
MPVTDSIADYITRIRNAGKAHHKHTDIPYSKLKENISKLLLDKGYIKDYTVITTEKFPIIRVQIKYDMYGNHVIKHLKRVSRPGLRKYSGKDIRSYLGGLGLYVITTSKGIVSDKEARQMGLGGEVLFSIH